MTKLSSIANRWGAYHRGLFGWHCRYFYPFHAELTEIELKYLACCFDLCESETDVQARGYRHLSYYSYSHRICGDSVNSSRIAWGTVLYPDKLAEAAREVLLSRGIVIDRYFFGSGNSSFYGLGWDLAERHFKIYFRVQQVKLLPQPELQELVARSPSPFRQEALVSFTYESDALIESKVYLYPQPGAEVETHRTLMVTDRRGPVPQDDIAGSESHQALLQRLSPPGRAIVAKYLEIGLTTDTVAFEREERYTLYFP